MGKPTLGSPGVRWGGRGTVKHTEAAEAVGKQEPLTRAAPQAEQVGERLFRQADGWLPSTGKDRTLRSGEPRVQRRSASSQTYSLEPGSRESHPGPGTAVLRKPGPQSWPGAGAGNVNYKRFPTRI